MLALERRPEGPRARTMFLQARAQAYGQLIDVIRELTRISPGPRRISWPPTAMAGADGLFIAKEIGGDSVDLIALFEMSARVLYDTALQMIAEGAEDDSRAAISRAPSGGRPRLVEIRQRSGADLVCFVGGPAEQPQDVFGDGVGGRGVVAFRFALQQIAEPSSAPAAIANANLGSSIVNRPARTAAS